MHVNQFIIWENKKKRSFGVFFQSTNKNQDTLRFTILKEDYLLEYLYWNRYFCIQKHLAGWQRHFLFASEVCQWEQTPNFLIFFYKPLGY